MLDCRLNVRLNVGLEAKCEAYSCTDYERRVSISSIGLISLHNQISTKIIIIISSFDPNNLAPITFATHVQNVPL